MPPNGFKFSFFRQYVMQRGYNLEIVHSMKQEWHLMDMFGLVLCISDPGK